MVVGPKRGMRWETRWSRELEAGVIDCLGSDRLLVAAAVAAGDAPRWRRNTGNTTDPDLCFAFFLLN